VPETALGAFYPYFLACLCVWREGRGQSVAARRGIWWALQNRVGKPQFRPSLVRVILQPWQFSSFNANDPNSTKFPNEAVSLDWQAWVETLNISESPDSDPTGGAVYYESFDPAELDTIRAKDAWFAADKMTVQIDAVRFYRA
jgi:hypothetical protein